MRGRAGILCKRSADGRAVVTTPRSGRHCRWPTARSRRPSRPRSSRAQRSRVDDTIIGLAAGHSGHAHPPACVPPAPSAPPSQVPCRRRALRAVQRSSPSRVPWCYPGSLTGFPRRPTASTRSEAESRKRTAYRPPTRAAVRTRPPRPPPPLGRRPPTLPLLHHEELTHCRTMLRVHGS